jgi:ATP-binding cassette subfamily C protein CydCD
MSRAGGVGGAPTGRGPFDARLMRELPVVRQALVGLGGATVVMAGCTVAQAVLLAQIISSVFARPLTTHVGAQLIGLAAVMGIKACAGGSIEWIAQRASASVRTGLRHHLLDAVARLGPRWLADADRPALVAAAGPGIEGLDGYVTRAMPAMVAAAVTPVVVLVAIGFADPSSLAILLVTLPLVPVFLALIGVTTRRRMERQWATLGRLSGQFLDLLQGLTTLKIYGRTGAQVAAVRDGTDRYRRQTLATLRVAFLSGLVLDLLATLSVAVVAVEIGLRLDRGGLTLASALTVLLLAPEVFAPLRAVGAQHHATEEARVVIGTAMDAIDAAAARDAATPSVDPTPDACTLSTGLSPDADGTLVRLEGVDFTYPGRDRPALRGVDLVIGAHELTVLSGASGAGKSTLLAVMLGQIVPTGGSMCVGPDAVALGSQATAQAWRSNLAWVPQRPCPTQTTVAAEVRLGDPGLGDVALDRILALCAAPPGPTATGEDGMHLSAGQLRRLALARAVARAEAVAATGRVPLVVLDEPTEDLDAATQAVVVEVVSGLAAWSAVVVATHDPVLRSLARRDVSVVDGSVTSGIRPGSPPGGRSGDVPMRVADGGPARSGGPAVIAAGELSVRRRDPTPSSGRAGTVVTGPPSGPLEIRSALMAAPGAVRALLIAMGLGALAGVSGLALTGTSIWMIVRAAQHPNLQALGLAIVGVRTFALAKALLRYAERLESHDGALRLLGDVRARVFAALVPLTPSGLGELRRGDLLRRFTNDVDGAQEALIRAVVPIAGTVVTAAAAAALAALIVPRSAAVLGAGLVAVVAVLACAQRAGSGADAGSAAAGRRAALVTGMLDGLEELSAYGATDARVDEVAAADMHAARAGRRAGAAGAATTALVGVIGAVTVAGIIGVGAHAVARGAVSSVMLGVLAVAGLLAFESTGALAPAFAALGRCSAGLHRVDEVLGAPIPVPEPLHPQGVPVGLTGMIVQDATLAPGSGAPPVLAAAQLRVSMGQRIGVVGPSGAGKSTLLAALLRLLTPETGWIGLCDGDGVTPLVDLRSGDVPAAVSGSLQGDHVFATTLRDNVRLVAPDAGDLDLDLAADRVGLGDWVRELPDGWSTQAGADGSRLSGGQRQRLLLMRALLADTPILILDEPTAHLDAVTERAVMADLIDSTVGRTLVLSTHRLALLDTFDLCVTIQDRCLRPALRPRSDEDRRPSPDRWAVAAAGRR